MVVDTRGALEPWAHFWYRWVSSTFLKHYYETLSASAPDLLPTDPEARQTLLDVYLLEKALYELGYEIDNRPDWIRIPVGGILRLVEESENGSGEESETPGDPESDAPADAPGGDRRG